MAKKVQSADAKQAARDEVKLKKDGKRKASNAAPAERKVRIETEEAAGKKTDKAKPSSKGKSAAKEPKTSSKASKGSAAAAAAAPVVATQAPPTEIINDSGKKHSPKHRDSKQQPSKPAIKKTTKKNKRKADDAALSDDAEDDAADESRVTEAETSAAGQRKANGLAVDNTQEEEIDFLAGFESGSDDEAGSDADSSDEEVDKAVVLQELPQPAKGTGKNAAKGKSKKDAVGVVYLGRIPHGFYEQEMRSYFEQFGEVTRLRLSRNKSTGASKHYAFIEFKHSTVAEIVAETMNNYLLHGHILQCKVVPPEEVHPKMWIGANRTFRPIPKGRVERLRHNAPKSDDKKQSIAKRLVKREDAKRARLSELGIDYDFPGYSGNTLPSVDETKAIEETKKVETEVHKNAPVAGKAAKAGKGAQAKPNKRARKYLPRNEGFLMRETAYESGMKGY